MTVTSRIEDLRRRVARDPASIAFAQLAEEHRRSGDYEEAVRVARVGLEHLPGYLSARVTLGRALWQLGQVDAARLELESVLAAAPDNLAAVRTLAEIHTLGAITPSEPALPAAVAAAVTVGAGERAADAVTSFAAIDSPPASREAVDEVAAFLNQLGQFAVDDSRTGAPESIQADGAVVTVTVVPAEAAAVAALERWLAAIVVDRAARR